MSTDTSYIHNADPAALDQLYQQYQKDRESVDFGWQKFFEGFDLGTEKYQAGGAVSEDAINEIKVLNLIQGYRQRGHLFSKTNPIRQRRDYTPKLDIEEFGLSKDDLGKKFNAGVELGMGQATLEDIITKLKKRIVEVSDVNLAISVIPKEDIGYKIVLSKLKTPLS